jgi:hypothetical protein
MQAAHSSTATICRLTRRLLPTIICNLPHILGMRHCLAARNSFPYPAFYSGVDDSVIQGILRHSTVATTQNHYIKTSSPDAIAAMRQVSEALLCSK